MRFVFFLPMIGAIIGAFIVMLTLAASGSAPQEAAGYAMACAFAVVPYVFARAIQSLNDDSPTKLTDKIIEAIRISNTTSRN